MRDSCNIDQLFKIQKFGIPLLLLVLCASSLAAQTGVLFVEGDNVGIGNATPGFKLDIAGTDSSTRVQVINTGANAARTMFKLANNGFPRFVLEDTAAGAQWLMAVANAGDFVFGKVGTGVNEFVIQGGGHLTVPGSVTAPVFITSSSRNLKVDLVSVDGRDVLARLSEIPISEWSFKTESSGTRHLGPMAQDFRAAFGLGSSDEYIGLMDAAGVTMAAIQGLHDMVRERDAEVAELKRQNAVLVEELAALKEAVHSLTAK